MANTKVDATPSDAEKKGTGDTSGALTSKSGGTTSEARKEKAVQPEVEETQPEGLIMEEDNELEVDEMEPQVPQKSVKSIVPPTPNVPNSTVKGGRYRLASGIYVNADGKEID